MGAALSTDRLHGEVLAASVVRREGNLILGPAALLAVVPDVRRLAWPDVDAARRLRGLPRLRDVLAEVEHRAHYHQHEHNHAPLIHAHEKYGEDEERADHDGTAHVHDHEAPLGRGA